MVVSNLSSGRRRGWFGWRRAATVVPFVLALSAAVVGAGCDGCSGCGSKLQAPVNTTLAEVAAPSHVAANVFVPNPAKLYGQMRATLPGPMGLLPASFPSATAVLLGVPAQMLDQIEAEAPAFGVVTNAGDKAGFVVALKLQNGARAVQLVTTGKEAAFTAGPAQGGVIALTRRTPGSSSVASHLAVAGDYLVAGSTSDLVASTGLYVAGSLPPMYSRQFGSEKDVDLLVEASKASLQGTVAARLKSMWESFQSEQKKQQQLQQQQAGRPADFGEPEVALAEAQRQVDSIIKILSSLERATVRVNVSDKLFTARATMLPASADTEASKIFQGWMGGDTSPLTSLGQDTLAAVMLRSTPASRAESAKNYTNSIVSMLGTRIKDADKEKLGQTIERWQAGRGDWLVMSVQGVGPGAFGVTVSGAVANAQSVESALGSTFELLRAPGFREPIDHHLGKVSLGKKTSSQGVTSMVVKRDTMLPTGVRQVGEGEVAWRIGAERFDIVLGENMRARLTEAGKPGGTLGEVPAYMEAFRVLDKSASVVVFADPNALLRTALANPMLQVQGGPSPMLVAFGARSGTESGTKQADGNGAVEGWWQVTVPRETMSALFKSLMGTK